MRPDGCGNDESPRICEGFAAGLLDVCSNHCIAGFSPNQLRKLAFVGDREDGSSKAPTYRAQALAKRLEPGAIAEIVRRARAGESARSLAIEYVVAPSSMAKLLRENGVTVSRRTVTKTKTRILAREYEDGATMRELETKHGLSHGAVLRALHRSGVTMRAKAPRSRI
ncbi:hypothetical protein ABA31_15000 [Agrococcus baldri]|uniref:Helix-turn-helix domain-containing protein n=1 Tax=Agrococcus baldri TaxID=153730 RepID=A0AA87RBS1_9MICO|nr:hypothetical protein ABA31_15000 [Agrococcus baldri]